MTTSLALDTDFCKLLLSSHLRVVGTPLTVQTDAQGNTARWLYEDAPFCVVAHNTDADPRFMYANCAAQKCFEYSWSEMTALRSRLSAEHPNRHERDALLESVRNKGYASGYRGLRIAKSGRRFWIEDVTVWDLIDDDGVYCGQAATYRQWQDV